MHFVSFSSFSWYLNKTHSIHISYIWPNQIKEKFLYLRCQTDKKSYTIITISIGTNRAGLGGSVGCAVRLETRRSRFNPRRGRQHSFAEIDHEIFSTVILSLLLIQEGQLSVSGERMCTILVNHLED